MTKLRLDEEVSFTILSKICKTFNADFGDIVEYVPDAEIWDLYNENRELIGKDHVRGEQMSFDGKEAVLYAMKMSYLYRIVVLRRLGIDEKIYIDNLKKRVCSIDDWNRIQNRLFERLK